MERRYPNKKTIATAAEVVRSVKGMHCQILCSKETSELAVIVLPEDGAFLYDYSGGYFTVATCRGDITADELERQIKRTFSMRDIALEFWSSGTRKEARG